MIVYVKTVELLENKEVQKTVPTCRCPYKLRSYRLANNKIAREEKNNVYTAEIKEAYNLQVTYTSCKPVSYTHLTLPTIYSV